VKIATTSVLKNTAHLDRTPFARKWYSDTRSTL